MNHCVPDFDIQMDDEDCPIPFPRQKKLSMADDEIMELLWQNGQVVMQSQNHRPSRKPQPARNSGDEIPTGPSAAREVRPEVDSCNQHLFMQEDEMISWLHHPMEDVDPPLDQTFCADFLYAPQTVNAHQSSNNNGNSAMQTPARTSQMTELRPRPRTAAAPRPPIPRARRPEKEPAKTPNFAYFAKHNARAEAPGPSSSSKKAAAAGESATVVESCDTPVAAAAAAAAATSRVSETVRCSAENTEGDAGRRSMSSAGAAAPSTVFDLTMTSSPGGSSSSGEPVQRAAAEDRKRKGREAEDWECQSEDVDFESAEAKKQGRGSTSTKRSRAAEVHNLSERRRRDRINEKMRALQELIPRCNKSDKASMLDEAIEYLKSLQLQVQMMSMGCGMVPMMFPGIQQYMPAMGMGIGMGMGMEMGMNRPVMPFPNMLAGSALPATAAAHLGPRFPMPPFHMPHVPAPDASRMQAANQPDHNMLTSVGTPDPNQTRIPNFTDPYQQYQVQFQLMQNQAMNQANVSKPSTSGGPENPENHQPGRKVILR